MRCSLLSELAPRYVLVVKVRDGLIVRDRPAPESWGALAVRKVPMGTGLLATAIFEVNGAQYGMLVPSNPFKPEYVRVHDSDHEYVEVVELNAEGEPLAMAVNRLAEAIDKLAEKG